MEDSLVFSTDSEDSLLGSSKLDSKDLSLTSPTSIASKINALNNLKYGVGGGHDKLAELFRKDLISAMKLPDTELLQPEEYHIISDPWRQDWERGVQVPINPDYIKESNVVLVSNSERLLDPYGFKLPKKLLHATQDNTYKQGLHELHEMQTLAEEVCRYDLDELDIVWLKKYNELRVQCGDEPLGEWMMERVIEMLETHCYDGMQEAIKTAEGLGIEYDEDVVCDICRSPEVEEGNEMVFCDGCDICVHQACYGILKIPKGNWLCKTCILNVKPDCILCPNTGGAMKVTEDGLHWAHLICAIWIPEVSIGCPETMQPIKDVDQIPAKRKALICTLCRERVGACIQCCVKKCKTAFHVTCAFRHNLEMKVNLEDDNSDIQLKAYCPLHAKKLDSEGSPRKTPNSTPKKANEMTEEEKKAERSLRLQKLAEEFYVYVNSKNMADMLQLDKKTVDVIHDFWILKRKCYFNKALLTPKVEEGDLLLKQREDTMVAKLKMFIHLRQDLERVRNLCYMVTKREKLRSQLDRIKMQLFFQQLKILRKEKLRQNGREFKYVVNAHRQCMTMYDQPENIVQTAKFYESFAGITQANGSIKTAKVTQKSTPVNSKVKQRTLSENPYAKPTYKSFSWILSSRRRRSKGNDHSIPDLQNKSVEPREKKRRGRRPRVVTEHQGKQHEDSLIASTPKGCSSKYLLAGQENGNVGEQEEKMFTEHLTDTNSFMDKDTKSSIIRMSTSDVMNCLIGSLVEKELKDLLDDQNPAKIDVSLNLLNTCKDSMSSMTSRDVSVMQLQGSPCNNECQPSPLPCLDDKWSLSDSEKCSQVYRNSGKLSRHGLRNNNTSRKQSETLLNGNLVAEADDKSVIIPSASKALVLQKDSDMSSQHSVCPKPRKRFLSKTLPNGIKHSRSYAKRRKLCPSFQDCAANSGNKSVQQHRTEQHLKENGVLKSQTTIDRFVQKVKRETDRNRKQNGHLNEMQQTSNHEHLNDTNSETVSFSSHRIDKCQLSQSSSSNDDDLLLSSQNSCNLSSSRCISTPRKRNCGSFSADKQHKKQFTFGDCVDVHNEDSTSCMKDQCNKSEGLRNELNFSTGLNSSVLNGFSPTKRRYRTRQSLGTR